MKNILRFILLILLVLSTGCSNSSSKKQILDCDYYNYGMDYNVQFLYENNILHSIVIYNSFDYSDSNMSIDEVLHPDNIEKQENSLLEMFGSEFDTNNNGKVLIHSSLIDWSNLDYRFTENVGIGKEVIEESLSISSLKSKIEEISSSTIGKKTCKILQ